MAEAWVVNASPLIILSRIDRLGLLEQLAPAIMVPAAVISEVSAGLAHDLAAPSALQWTKNRTVADVPLPASIIGWGLGVGESQVIAHCLNTARAAVLDDLAGRACARAYSVAVIGTLGILLLAKERALIPLARPWVIKARTAGLFLDSALVEQALAAVGE